MVLQPPAVAADAWCVRASDLPRVHFREQGCRTSCIWLGLGHSIGFPGCFAHFPAPGTARLPPLPPVPPPRNIALTQQHGPAARVRGRVGGGLLWLPSFLASLREGGDLRVAPSPGASCACPARLPPPPRRSPPPRRTTQSTLDALQIIVASWAVVWRTPQLGSFAACSYARLIAEEAEVRCGAAHLPAGRPAGQDTEVT